MSVEDDIKQTDAVGEEWKDSRENDHEEKPLMKRSEVFII